MSVSDRQANCLNSFCTSMMRDAKCLFSGKDFMIKQGFFDDAGQT